MNRTPILRAARQATQQLRFKCSGLIRSVKSSGMPTELSTSRQAPVTDKLRMTQSMAAAKPNRIEPPFRVRCLGFWRGLVITSAK